MQRIVLIVVTLVLVLAGCTGSQQGSARYTEYDSMINHSKPIAFGDDNVIHVFCGAENWAKLGPHITETIERELYLVYPEKYFHVQYSEIKEIGSLNKFKNLIFLGDLASGDGVSNYMKQTLADDFIQRVEETGGDMFVAKNHWVRDQLVIYILATDTENLMRIGGLQQNQMFSILLQRYTERLAYQAYLAKVIPASFWEPYPFSMQIPESFRLYSNDRVNRFVSFLYRARMQNREIPDKYISVYYEDMPTNKVDSNWLINKKREIGERHFEGDIIEEKDLRIEKFQFAGYEGWRILGSWKNMNHMIGGAFQAHGFWDEKNKRAYVVDNSVYFPAGDKLPTLLELFMISSSFKVK